MLLTPAARYGSPFEYNMAGLSVEQQMDGSYLVRSVVEGSPGAEAEILRGDRIVRLDDRDAEAYAFRDATELFQQEGRSLRLVLERNGDRLERTVILRRLI